MSKLLFNFISILIYLLLIVGISHGQLYNHDFGNLKINGMITIGGLYPESDFSFDSSNKEYTFDFKSAIFNVSTSLFPITTERYNFKFSATGQIGYRKYLDMYDEDLILDYLHFTLSFPKQHLELKAGAVTVPHGLNGEWKYLPVMINTIKLPNLYGEGLKDVFTSWNGVKLNYNVNFRRKIPSKLSFLAGEVDIRNDSFIVKYLRLKDIDFFGKSKLNYGLRANTILFCGKLEFNYTLTRLKYDIYMNNFYTGNFDYLVSVYSMKINHGKWNFISEYLTAENTGTLAAEYVADSSVYLQLAGSLFPDTEVGFYWGMTPLQNTQYTTLLPGIDATLRLYENSLYGRWIISNNLSIKCQVIHWKSIQGIIGSGSEAEYSKRSNSFFIEASFRF